MDFWKHTAQLLFKHILYIYTSLDFDNPTWLIIDKSLIKNERKTVSIKDNIYVKLQWVAFSAPVGYKGNKTKSAATGWLGTTEE